MWLQPRNAVLKKTPEQFRIQIELASDQDLGSTTVGQELIEYINDIITAIQAEDGRTRKDIAAARRAKDKDQVTALQAELADLGPVLDRLKADQNKLEAPVNWEQAEIDNIVLDRAVMRWHELVTTDWKAKYDELLVEHNQFKAGFLFTMLAQISHCNQGTARIGHNGLEGQIRQVIG
jgi:hypothetical protein